MDIVMILLAAIAVVFVGLGLFTGNALPVATIQDDGSTVVDIADAPNITRHIEPTNPATWPSGNRLWDCCRAIATAEGYDVPNSNPARLNNPGDISDGLKMFGYEFHSGSHITKFPDANTGWQWLYVKLSNAVNGLSNVYDASMSWREIGAIWAPPNAEIWAANVSSYLGVNPDSSLSDYVNG
jgi:hypothetical protein